MNHTLHNLVLESIVVKLQQREYMKKYHKTYNKAHREEKQEYNKAHYEKHKEKKQKQSKTYHEEHREEVCKQHKAYYAKRPWSRCYWNAKTRCENPKHPSYKWYGGRGIKFLLTLKEVKMLYLRDKAVDMKRPSIDRINNDGDYCFENCRFIELSENTKKGGKANETDPYTV